MVFVKVPGHGIINLDRINWIGTHVEDDKSNGVVIDFGDTAPIAIRFNEVTFPYRSWVEFHDLFLVPTLNPSPPKTERPQLKAVEDEKKSPEGEV